MTKLVIELEVTDKLQLDWMCAELDHKLIKPRLGWINLRITKQAHLISYRVGNGEPKLRDKK